MRHIIRQLKRRYKWWRLPKAEKEQSIRMQKLLGTLCKSKPGTPDGIDIITSGKGGSWEQNAGQLIDSKNAIQDYVDTTNRNKVS